MVKGGGDGGAKPRKTVSDPPPSPRCLPPPIHSISLTWISLRWQLSEALETWLPTSHPREACFSVCFAPPSSSAQIMKGLGGSWDSRSLGFSRLWAGHSSTITHKLLPRLWLSPYFQHILWRVEKRSDRWEKKRTTQKSSLISKEEVNKEGPNLGESSVGAEKKETMTARCDRSLRHLEEGKWVSTMGVSWGARNIGRDRWVPKISFSFSRHSCKLGIWGSHFSRDLSQVDWTFYAHKTPHLKWSFRVWRKIT